MDTRRAAARDKHGYLLQRGRDASARPCLSLSKNAHFSSRLMGVFRHTESRADFSTAYLMLATGWCPRDGDYGMVGLFRFDPELRQLLHKGLGVAEFAVDRGEANIGYLVDLA